MTQWPDARRHEPGGPARSQSAAVPAGLVPAPPAQPVREPLPASPPRGRPEHRKPAFARLQRVKLVSAGLQPVFAKRRRGRLALARCQRSRPARALQRRRRGHVRRRPAARAHARHQQARPGRRPQRPSHAQHKKPSARRAPRSGRRLAPLPSSHARRRRSTVNAESCAMTTT